MARPSRVSHDRAWVKKRRRSLELGNQTSECSDSPAARGSAGSRAPSEMGTARLPGGEVGPRAVAGGDLDAVPALLVAIWRQKEQVGPY